MGTLTLATGETLCLNGHSITLADSAEAGTPVITISYSNAYDGTVICDCCPEAHAGDPTYGYWVQTGTQTIDQVDEWDEPYQVTIPTYEYKLTKTLSEVSDEVMPHDTITGGYITGGTGGGVAIDSFNSDEKTGVFVYNCTIAGNVNSDNGGGVAGGRKRLYLNNTQIVGNQSQDDGGGLYSAYTSTTYYYPSGVQINDGTVISHNIALGDGGGISAKKAILNGEVKVDGNLSLNGSGGGIYANGLEVAPGEGKTVSISGNKAAVNGGGVAVDSSSTTALKLANAKIEKNEAGENGGGVWLAVAFEKGDGYSTVENCSVSNNIAGENGGGLYIDALSKSSYSYYNFGAELTGTTVAQNTAKQGGGVYFWAHNYYYGVSSEQPLVLKAGTSITKNKATQWGGGVVLENPRSRLAFQGGMVADDNTLSDEKTASTIGLSGAEQDSRYIGYLPQLIFETGFNESDEITLGVSVAEGTFSDNDSTVYYYFYEDDLPDNVSIKNEGDYGVLSFHNYHTGYDTIFFTLPVPMVRLSGDFPSYEVYGNQGDEIPVTYQWNHMRLGTPVPVTDANAKPYNASYAEDAWSIVKPRLGLAGEDTSLCVALCDVFDIDLQAGESISFTTPKSLLDYLTVTFGEETHMIAPTLEGNHSDETIEFTYVESESGDSLIWTATAPESDEYVLYMVLFHDNGVSAKASAEALYNYVTETLKLTDVKKVGYEVESKITPIEGPGWESDTVVYSESLFLKQMEKGEAYAADVTYKQPQKEKGKYESNAASWDDAQTATFRSAVIIANPMIYDAYTETTYQPNPYTVDLSAMFFFFDPIPGTEDVTVQYQDENREWVTKAENENLTLTKTPLSDILDEWTGLGMPSVYREFYEKVLTDYHTVQLPLDGTYDADRYKLVITAKDGDKTVSSEDMPYTPGLYINTATSELEDVDGGKILSGITSTYTVTLPDDGYTYAQKGSLPTGVQSATVSGNILTIVTTDGVAEGAFTLKFTASKKNYRDCDLTVNLTGVRLPDAAITISGLTESETYDGQAVSASASSTEDPTMTYTYTWQENTGTADSPVWTSLTQAPKDVGSYRLMITGVSSTHMGSATQAFAIVPKALTWDTSDLSAAKPQNSEAEANVYGELKVTGLVSGDGVSFTSPSGMTTNGLSGTEQTVGEHADTPLKLADDAAWSSLTLTGTGTANYTMPTGAPTITAVVNKVEGKTESDPLPTPPESADNKQLKLEMEHGISDVPGALASNPGLNTPTKIVDKMTESIQTENTSIAEENTAVYEVTLLVSTDSGASWTEATAANFPAEGLTVTLPYPEGTNSSYRFTVVHMFTEGESAGTVEYPVVTNTAEGIQFKVTSLSPIAVGWTAPISSGGGGGVSTYSISLPSNIPNGKLTSDRKTASKGTTVTLTATPDDGYTLDTLTVTDKDGKQLTLTNKGNGKYTFTMPAGKVTASASFVKSGDAPCGKVDCPVGRFTDTSVTAWYHDGIHYCVEKGMMSGVGGNAFAPNAISSRAMIATMLWQLEGAPVVNDTLNYEDTVEGVWYTEAVRWAVSKGILQGYGNGKFGPNDDVTREQMVTILLSYAKYKGYDVSVGEDTNILSFGDATTVAEYAIPAMQWACGSGIVGGKDAADGSGLILDPKGSTTRAEMATMMMRFCAEIVK